MTVKELIAKLSEFKDNLQVWVELDYDLFSVSDVQTFFRDDIEPENPDYGELIVVIK